jgi:hypothetical protein
MPLRQYLLRFLSQWELTLKDLHLSKVGQLGLKGCSTASRVGLFEACEIIRLVNADPSFRAAAEKIRDKLMEESKASHNLLPHEGKSTVKKEDHPLLPRFDVQ